MAELFGLWTAELGFEKNKHFAYGTLWEVGAIFSNFMDKKIFRQLMYIR